MIKALIFDLDGTLVDAYPGIHESLNEMLRHLNLPEIDLQTVKRRVGRGVVDLVQQSVPPNLVQDGLKLFRSSYDNTHLSGTFLMPDIAETLRNLLQRRILLAVASNKPIEFTTSILRHLKLDDFLSEIAGPNSVIQPKPHPSMLKHLMQRLEVTADETLYVGDMMLDAETARNAGVRLALIPSGGHSREELERMGPDYLLNRFTGLIGIVESEI